MVLEGAMRVAAKAPGLWGGRKGEWRRAGARWWGDSGGPRSG